jgi:hypothetical protein
MIVVFTLLGSRCSVRVQVRLNREPNSEREHELRSEQLEA